MVIRKLSRFKKALCDNETNIKKNNKTFLRLCYVFFSSRRHKQSQRKMRTNFLNKHQCRRKTFFFKITQVAQQCTT